VSDWRDDYDFPCSETYIGYLYEINGSNSPQDRDRIRPINEVEPRPIEKNVPWNNRQWDYVQQLKAQILFLESKINEHIDKPKQAQRQLKAIDV
jgi:hypothetical protein